MWETWVRSLGWDHSFAPSLIYIYIYMCICTHTHTYIHMHLHTDMILWSKVELNSTEPTKIANLCLLLFFLTVKIQIYFIFFLFFTLFYNTVLVLPYININPPRVYTCSQSWTPLPPPSPYHLSAVILSYRNVSLQFSLYLGKETDKCPLSDSVVDYNSYSLR